MKLNDGKNIEEKGLDEEREAKIIWLDEKLKPSLINTLLKSKFSDYIPYVGSAKRLKEAYSGYKYGTSISLDGFEKTTRVLGSISDIVGQTALYSYPFHQIPELPKYVYPLLSRGGYYFTLGTEKMYEKMKFKITKDIRKNHEKSLQSKKENLVNSVKQLTVTKTKE